MKHFNPGIIAVGTLILLLMFIDSLADRGGILGVYSPEEPRTESDGKIWEPPTRLFHSAGCCVDDVRSATWERTREGTKLVLHAGAENIPLYVDAALQVSKRLIPGGSDLLAFVYLKDRIWVPEKFHQRLLEVKANGQYETQVGSNMVGAVNGLTITCADPVTLVLSTGARGSMHQFLLQQQAASVDTIQQDKLYFSRFGPSSPALVQITPDSNNGPAVLNIGDDLSAPSGLALSSDGRTLYVADEREDELAWLKLVQTNDPARPWASQGKLARFRLDASQHGFVRGLLVINYKGQDILAGATPAGLAFMTPDGHRLGTIQTNEQISWVIRGQREKTPLLYVVAGRSIWQAALHHLTPAPSAPCVVPSRQP